MVKNCCVYSCPSESYGGCNVSFHSLPKNEEMRQKWLSSIHVKQKITKYSVVCSRHFEPSSFYTGNSRQLLKTNAIPTFPFVVKQERVWITDDVEAKEEGISPSQSPILLAEDNVMESNNEKNKSYKVEDETEAEEETDTEDDAEKCILCKTKVTSETNDILLSRFPLDPAICLAWAKRVGVKKLIDMPIQKLHDTKFLCQFHFNPGCFIKKGDSLVLRPQAVPSEELCFPASTDSMKAKFSKDGSFRNTRKRLGSSGTDTEDYCDVEYLDENTLQCDDGSEAALDEGGNDQAASNTAQNPVYDDIDTLFQSYAGAFKKLSCKLQTMLKLDIAKLFARYEIKNLEMEKEKSKAAEIEIQEAPKTKLKKPPPREKAQSKKLKTVTPPKMLYHSIGPTVHKATHSPTIECQSANPVMMNITSQQIVPLAAPHQRHSPLATAKECQSIEKPVMKIITPRQTVTLEKGDNTRNANVSVEPSGVKCFVLDPGQKFELAEKPSKIRKVT